MVKHSHKKEKIKKSSLSYNIKTSEDKTKINLNEGKFGLKPFFKKQETNVLSTRRYRIYLAVNNLTKLFVILRIEIFCHFLITSVTINVFRYLTFSLFRHFFLHAFFLTKNVIPCDIDVMENYLKHTKSLQLF